MTPEEIHVERTAQITGTSSRDWPATFRAVGALGAAVAISWRGTENVKYLALAIVGLVASPALARAIIAPRLAAVLRSSGMLPEEAPRLPTLTQDSGG